MSLASFPEKKENDYSQVTNVYQIGTLFLYKFKYSNKKYFGKLINLKHSLVIAID